MKDMLTVDDILFIIRKKRKMISKLEDEIISHFVAIGKIGYITKEGNIDLEIFENE